MRRNVAVLIFDEVEVLDFAGPLAVFSTADEIRGRMAFKTFTLAETPSTVRTADGLKLIPDYTPESAPLPDVMILPGGPGAHRLLRRSALIEWIRNRSRRAEVTLAVRAGSLVLARAGLLDGLRAPASRDLVDSLRALAPTAVIDSAGRFCDHGTIAAAADAGAGIDGSLRVVARLLGPPVADHTRRHLGCATSL